jgi:TPR repeat protein
VAATLASRTELLNKWLHGGDSYGMAVLTGAVQARLCGHPEPIGREVLGALAQAQLTGAQRAKAKPASWLDDALTWACQPVRGDITALSPYGTTVGSIDGYQVSDILVDHATSNPRRAPLSAVTWQLLIESASPTALLGIGCGAYYAVEFDFARAAWSLAIDAGNTEALEYLGVVLARAGGRVEEVEALFRRAIDAGHSDALFNLGVLLARGGRDEEVEALYRRAIDAGDTDALNSLGVLLAERGGRDEEAEALYRRAIDAGHTDALNSLGYLRAERGSRDEQAEPNGGT